MAGVEDSNRIKKQEALAMQNLNERTMQKINNNYNTKLEEYKNNVERAYIGQVDEANKARKMNLIQTDNSKKRMAQTYANNLLEQTEFHDKQTETQKREHEKTLNEQRISMQKDQLKEVKNLRELGAKQNTEAQEKLLGTIDKYEGQIAQLKQDYEKKLKRQGELYKEQTDKQNQYLQMDREANEAKTQARVNQLKESYEHQIETLRRKQAQENQEKSINQTKKT